MNQIRAQLRQPLTEKKRIKFLLELADTAEAEHARADLLWHDPPPNDSNAFDAPPLQRCNDIINDIMTHFENLADIIDRAIEERLIPIE